VSKELECKYFFAKPYHSWERGSNENLNGLIRDYFPESLKFYDITRKQIYEVQEALNNRPRKRHKFLTPIEFQLKNLKEIDLRCICN
jgi:IS30 family transposase